MRILFFSDNFKPEPCPPAAHVYERAKLWVDAGHEVTVITTAPNFPEGKVYPGYRNDWYRVEYMEGIRVVRVKTFITRNEGFALRVLDIMSFVLPALIAGLFQQKPDVILSTSPQPCAPMAGVLCGAFRRVPHVFELRDLWPASMIATTAMKKRKVYRLLERGELFLYQRSEAILSITRSFVEDLALRGVPRSKMDVVINGTNLSLFTPRPKDPTILKELGLENRFVVGYLGTLGAAHGLDNVIETAERLQDQPITFLFVGVGSAKARLEAMVREKGLTNVIFAPRQVREDMPRFCSVCDVALIHLRNNPVFETVIPSKIFESMAMGIAQIFSGPVGEGSALVAAEEVGLCVPPEDPEALAAAVRRLQDDPELRARLATNGRKAAANYSRERQAEGTLEVLEKAIDARRTRQAKQPSPAKRAADLVSAAVSRRTD